jgi:hypothetical protein
MSFLIYNSKQDKYIGTTIDNGGTVVSQCAWVNTCTWLTIHNAGGNGESHQEWAYLFEDEQIALLLTMREDKESVSYTPENIPVVLANEMAKATDQYCEDDETLMLIPVIDGEPDFTQGSIL